MSNTIISFTNVVYYKGIWMNEERYQYLNSLSLEEYDKETTLDEQEAFCEYQHKYHPDEVMYYQTHDPND